jgi:hypothetical protein
MSNPELRASLLCAPMLLGTWAGISSYAPSLDVYGFYFPVCLICLMVGVILTIGVRLTENVIQWESLRIKAVSVAVAIVLFTGCAQVATVRNVEPRAPTALSKHQARRTGSVGNTFVHSFPTERDARLDPETALSQTVEIAAKA